MHQVPKAISNTSSSIRTPTTQESWPPISDTLLTPVSTRTIDRSSPSKNTSGAPGARIQSPRRELCVVGSFNPRGRLQKPCPTLHSRSSMHRLSLEIPLMQQTHQCTRNGAHHQHLRHCLSARKSWNTATSRMEKWEIRILFASLLVLQSPLARHISLVRTRDRTA